MTIEEQRLSELLHRLTPEPPRPVTVEDIAIRLANNNAPVREGTRMPGSSRFGGRRLTPLLAAAAVVVIAGASTGVAVALSSNSGSTPPVAAGGTGPATSSQASSPTAATTQPAVSGGTSPGSGGTSPGSGGAPPITNGAWNASVAVPTIFAAGTMVASGSHLYGFTTNNLLEVDPATNTTVHEAPYNGFPNQAPVIAGGKVWTVSSYGAGIQLIGYDTQTLAQAGTINVPVTGLLNSAPGGILTAGPDGDLYVAAGSAVVKVNPANGSVLHSYPVSGSANAVAVSPDGTRLYVGSTGGSQFQISEFGVTGGSKLASATEKAVVGGDIVATPGGIWFTTGNSMAQEVWFAPEGSLSNSRLIAGAGNGGSDSVPTYADGVVWVGGSQRLQCLDPDTARLRAGSYIPTDNGTQEDIGDIAVLNGHVYAVYLKYGGSSGGVALLKPPSSCYA